MKRLKNRTPRLPPNPFIDPLFIWGIQYTSGYMYIHTQHYGIREVCTCSETKHNPNTFQTEKRLLNHIICRVHTYDNEKDSGMTLCIHHSLKSLLCQALESLTLYHYIFLTTTRGPWRKSCHRNSLGL